MIVQVEFSEEEAEALAGAKLREHDTVCERALGKIAHELEFERRRRLLDAFQGNVREHID